MTRLGRRHGPTFKMPTELLGKHQHGDIPPEREGGCLAGIKVGCVHLCQVEGNTMISYDKWLPIALRCDLWGPSRREIPEISKLSWNCPEILLMCQKCPEIGFWCAITCCSLLFLFAALTLSASCNHSNCLCLTTTSHYYLAIVDVDCPVVMLTVLWLHYSIVMFMHDFC